jgi:biopolymer transport protein ExbD
MTKISLTPVIDVVFILLIFFMLASNFNKVGEIDMDMTKETNSMSKDDIKVIELLIRQDETVISEGKVYDDDELVTMIKHAIKDKDNYSIILTSKEDVTYQRYMYMMSYLKNNELDNVNIGLKNSAIKSQK